MTSYARQLAKSRQFLRVEDVDLIQEILKEFPEEYIIEVVELGAGSGTTTCALMEGRPTRMRLTTVDTSSENLDWAVRNVEASGLGKSGGVEWTLENQLSWSAARYCNFLLVDAGHDYEDVKRDIDAWIPAMPRFAEVWFHDYSHEDYPGVRRAVDEAVASGKLQMRKDAGWGVWTSIA